MYFAFDILVYDNRDLTRLPLSERRRILAEVIHPNSHVRLSVASDRSVDEMLAFAKKHGLEGLIAKCADSVYQPGQRTGFWSKYRINTGQEFVIGGYVPSHLGIDQIVVGFYRGKGLIYSARVRAGFVPKKQRSRRTARLAGETWSRRVKKGLVGWLAETGFNDGELFGAAYN